MHRPLTWWQALSGAEKFRVYTRLTLQVTLVGVGAFLAVSSAHPWPVSGIVVAALAGAAVVEVQPGVTSRSGTHRRPVVVGGVAVLAAVWVGFALVALTADDDALVRGAGIAGTFTVLADGGMNDEEILRWLFTPDETLPVEGAPIDALIAGHKTEVRRRAQVTAF